MSCASLCALGGGSCCGDGTPVRSCLGSWREIKCARDVETPKQTARYPKLPYRERAHPLKSSAGVIKHVLSAAIPVHYRL